MLPLLQVLLYTVPVNSWTVVLVQVPSEPSRHRVAVWRELRKVGAVPVAAGARGPPARPAFEEGPDPAAGPPPPCEGVLEGYAEQVYDAMHGRSGGPSSAVG